MQKKFLRNLALLLVLNLLIKPFWIFGIDRTVQNTVGAESYGFYFAIFNFSFLFYILLDFGITTFNNKNIAQNNHLLRKHLSNIIVLKLLLFAVYLVFTFAGAFLIGYSEEQMKLLAYLGVNQFLVSFILYLRSNLGALHLFRTDSLISVLDRTLMILVCALLLWGNIVPEFRISYFVYAQTFSLSLTALITSVIVFHKARTRFLKLSWSTPFFLMMLRHSLPFAILVLLMTFYSRVDSVMLERMLEDGAKYSGIYASAYRLLDAANMIAYLFAVLLLPIFARMLKQNEPIEELIKLSFTLIITPAIIIAFASFFFAQEIMQWLYPIHSGESLANFAYRIEQSSAVFGLLMSSFLAVSTMYIFSTLLTANSNLKHLNLIAFSGMILNIGLNLVLIPRFQAYGSAVATLITQMLIALIQVWVVYRLFRFRINYPYLARLLIFIIGVALTGYFSCQLALPWHFRLIIMILFSALLALVIRLVSPRHLIQVLKYG
ncbi:MAG: oligosaccharide flippase family protein [Bacteroidales bacterium]